MSKGSLVLLGTGASAGIPVMGCSCAVCQSTNSKNKRLRASCLVRFKDKTILIDAGPDLHAQAISFGLKSIDGLLITHTHYDHIGGLEELRIFAYLRKSPILCLLSATSLSHLKKLFYYLFDEHSQDKTKPAKFDFRVLDGGRGITNFCGIPIRYFTYSQPNMEVVGYRFGDLAYVTDIKSFPDSIFEDLKDCKTLIISALRHAPTALQFSVDEAIEFAQRVRAETTYFIHMSHEIDHDTLEKILPPSIKLGFDGLEIAFELEDTQ